MLNIRACVLLTICIALARFSDVEAAGRPSALSIIDSHLRFSEPKKAPNYKSGFSWLKRRFVPFGNHTLAYEVEKENRLTNNMFGNLLEVQMNEMTLQKKDHEGLLKDLEESGITRVRVPEMRPGLSAPAPSESPGPYTPVVQMHGMGDAAKNGGMEQIRRSIAQRLEGSYVTNIEIGKNRGEDTSNSFFMKMDEQVDEFASRVRADERLAGGFNAIGYSQGNLVIRGYVERYNNPPVHVFVSMHGPLAGVAGFPNCKTSFTICKLIDRSLGSLAYTPSVQDHLAQANYFRDPHRIDEYKEAGLFLPDLNNEGEKVNTTYQKNFATLSKLVLIKALSDTEVVPAESEWFGFYKDGSTDEETIMPMEETPWYNLDSFGLKTLVQTGRVDKLTTPGNHLQFSEDFLLGLVDTYFKERVGTMDQPKPIRLVPFAQGQVMSMIDREIENKEAYNLDKQFADEMTGNTPQPLVSN